MTRNQDRAQTAQTAVDAYSQSKGYGPDEECLVDLLADLFHAVNQQGLNVRDTIERALAHFHAELEEELAEENPS